MVSSLGAAKARPTSQENKRIDWLDTAKAIGIFLVFYGHLLEMLYLNGYPELFAQFKFIYAFHMPLFFILAGFVYRERQAPATTFLKRHGRSRLVPFLTFNLLGLVCLILVHVGQGQLKPDSYLQGLLAMLRGQPAFNMLTWFLVCLFTMELLHFGLKRFWTSTRRLLLAAPLILLVGLLLTRTVADQGGWLVPKNFWFIHEAVVAYGFFLIGMLLQRGYRMGRERPWYLWGLLVLVLGAVTFFFVTLNQGPFVTEAEVVLMILSSHGHIGWFPITAITGSLLIVSLSCLTPSMPWLSYIGRNTLILLGLNGLFFEFFNKQILVSLSPYWSRSLPFLTVQLGLVTILSLLVCIPFIHFINRYIPQIVGKPTRRPAPVIQVKESKVR